MNIRFSKTILELSPHHLVDDAGVALDNLHDLGRDVFFDVVGHGDAVVAVGVHRDGCVDGLQEGLLSSLKCHQSSCFDQEYLDLGHFFVCLL